jgi:hypothetical protein
LMQFHCASKLIAWWRWHERGVVRSGLLGRDRI